MPPIRLKDYARPLEAGDGDAFSLFKSLRTLALLEVLETTHDGYMRHIYRWYSKNFHVPLPEVEALPLEHVLTNFFEDQYENLDEYAREEERQRLLRTDAETEAAEREAMAEKNRDAEWEKFALEEAARQRKQRDLQPQTPAAERKEIAHTKPRTRGPLPEIGAIETIATPVMPLPSISMTFLTEEEMNKRLDSDSSDSNLPITLPKNQR